jgi:hypothetical protein
LGNNLEATQTAWKMRIVMRMICICNKNHYHVMSRWQVRRPLYRTSVNRWRRWAPYLPEFGPAFGEAS